MPTSAVRTWPFSSGVKLCEAMWTTRSPVATASAMRGVDAASMRVVVGVEQLAPLAQRQVPRRFRMQLGVADRAVQVGEQARRLVVVERRVEALGHLAREQQRARVPAAMRRQQVLVADEERPVALRHDVAGVLAGDDESIGADVHRRDSGRTPARVARWQTRQEAERLRSEADVVVDVRAQLRRRLRRAVLMQPRIAQRRDQPFEHGSLRERVVGANVGLVAVGDRTRRSSR